MANWLLLFQLLPALEVGAWRYAERATSTLQSAEGLIQNMWGTSEMEVISSTAMEKVLCTRRLPYFRNRLCLQLKSHSAALEGAISAVRGSPIKMHHEQVDLMRAVRNPILAVPDLTIDLAWMGCSTCVTEMRVCGQDQICRKDPKDGLSYPWIRIFPISLESLVAGTCYGVADLLVSSTAAAAFAPFLGALAPYLSGLLGKLSGRVFDELILGRYCIYLSTHLAKEVLGNQVLSQDSTCIDHLYTIHIPGMFGIVKARKFNNPGTPIVCWPTAGEPVQGGPLFTAVDGDSGAAEVADDLEPPSIVSPSDILRNDKVCREGSSKNLCTACEVAIQAATWRLLELNEKIRSAGSLAKLVDQTPDDEDSGLEVVENKMLVHSNSAKQCSWDRDVGCLSDYSLCVLKTGMEQAEQCEVSTVHVAETKPFCWWLCNQESSCPSFSIREPFCAVDQDYVNRSCLVELRGHDYLTTERVQSSRFSSSHWVHCNPGGRAHYPKLWQHRMVKLYAKLRRTPGTTEQTRAAAERQVLQRLSEPAPSSPSLRLLDVSLLRIAQLAANRSIHELRTLFCREAACCSAEHEGMSHI